MNKLLIVLLATLTLAGCSRDTRVICAELDEVIRKNTGTSLTNAAHLECLNLPPSEAEARLKDALAVQDERVSQAQSKSRTDLENEFERHEPLWFAATYGEPDFFAWVSFGGENATFLESGKQPFSAFADKLNAKEDGTYILTWNQPISKNMFGSPDENMTVYVVMEDGKVAEKSLNFPSYLQRWMEELLGVFQ